MPDSTATTTEREVPRRDDASGTARRVGRGVAHRWPTWLALALVAVSLGDGTPPPPDTLALVAILMPLAYLGFGAARKELKPRSMLSLQLAALAFYIGLAAVALSVDDDLARYLVGFGWIAHAFWDAAHYRANRVAPRQWAEWCGVVDILLGCAILFAL